MIEKQMELINKTLIHSASYLLYQIIIFKDRDCFN